MTGDVEPSVVTPVEFPPMASIWKGSISFGLVSIPVSLHNATKREEFRVVANIVPRIVVFGREHHQHRIAAELVLGRPHPGRNIDALGPPTD